MTESQWGQLLIVATTVGGFVVTEYRANRNRRWAIQDRERAQAEAAAERRAATLEIIERAAAEAEATRLKTELTAESLRLHTELLAAKLREEARIGADTLVRDAAAVAADLEKVTSAALEEQRRMALSLADKVGEAAKAAQDAYKEANHVNIKIADLNKRLLSEEQKPGVTVDAEATEKIEKIDATTERIEERQKQQEPPKAKKTTT